ncbi:MAG: SIR2 family protein [Chloroflexi bacterium]|nr:SIR2 family protein [Chloroflexota bacterium]
MRTRWSGDGGVNHAVHHLERAEPTLSAREHEASARLPSGAVTYLFTDIEGSTRLWEHFPEQMRRALIRHDALIESCVTRHGGTLVRPRGEGDSRFAVFRHAADAAVAAAAIQSEFAREAWPPDAQLRIRIALHTGEADLREGDYYGSAVNRCARLRSLAVGGQILLTRATHDSVGSSLPPGAQLRDLGEHYLSDLVRPERIYQLDPPGLATEFPPFGPSSTLGAHCAAVVRAYIAGQLVLFLGESMNLSGRPPGRTWAPGRLEYLPTTQELAEYLATAGEYPYSSSRDLTRVTQYIATMQGSGPLYEQLHSLLDVNYSPTPFHEFLARLASRLRARGYNPRPPLIVTSSYDDALERAFDTAGEAYDLVVYVADGDRRGHFLHYPPDGRARPVERPNKYLNLSFSRPVILKIQGTVDRRNVDRDSFVVTEDNYVDYLGGSDVSGMLPVTIAARLRKSHFLFLSYRLREWNLRGILRRIWGERQLSYASWAVQSALEPLERELWRVRDVEVLDARLDQYLMALTDHVTALPVAAVANDR